MSITPSDIRRAYRSVCWAKTNLQKYQFYFWSKPMLITSSDIRRPYRSACETNTKFEWYQLSFWNKPMLLTPSDMKTLKYNNLTNLTRMIWHIDPATKILEGTQVWKLAFRIIETFQSRKWQVWRPQRSEGNIGDRWSRTPSQLHDKL